MITIENLIAAGYKPFKHHEVVCDELGYQKVFRGAAGEKLYFVQMYFWYFSKHFPRYASTDNRLSCEARLYLPENNPLGGSPGFDLKMSLSNDASIAAVEAFYAKVFNVLDCVPDLHNND